MCNFTYLEVLRGIKGRAFRTPHPQVHAEGHTLATRTSAAKSSDSLLMFPVQTHLLILSVPCGPVHEYQKQEYIQGSASTKTTSRTLGSMLHCASIRLQSECSIEYRRELNVKTNLLRFGFTNTFSLSKVLSKFISGLWSYINLQKFKAEPPSLEKPVLVSCFSQSQSLFITLDRQVNGVLKNIYNVHITADAVKNMLPSLRKTSRYLKLTPT